MTAYVVIHLRKVSNIWYNLIMISKNLHIYFLTIMFIFASQSNCYAYDNIIMPELYPELVRIDSNDIPPKEPVILEVKFKDIPILTSFKERIDRLTYGITAYIPPEYDHYGHEIRRYMAHIGNFKAYQDKDKLVEQLRNVKKAKVIKKYWQKHLKKEIDEIDNIIDSDENVSSVLRSSFSQNSSTARGFLLSLGLWLDANEEVLVFMYKNFDLITARYPSIIIPRARENLEFYNLVYNRQSTLKDIVEYTAYEMMVY